MKKDNQKPIAGNTRVIRKMVIFPKTLKNETKWLTTTHIKQKYLPQKKDKNRVIYKWMDI